MNVLLIEPDRVQAGLYKTALEKAGHNVVHARTAQAAVQAADAVTPDAVVLELQMPRHNGIEFLYEFHSYSEWQSIPVVIYTTILPKELEFSPTLKNDLGVVRVLHKHGTNLAELVAAVEAVVHA